MSLRPAISPEALADLTAAAPARLVTKRDAEPTLADAWTWTASDQTCTVTTEKGETVSLTLVDGAVRTAEAVRCSCLLSPRCLHVLAVLARLPLTDASDAASAEVSAEQTPAAEALDVEEMPLTLEIARAAESAWQTAADLLASGAAGCNSLREVALLRAVHAGRAAGAHRMASACARLVQWTRDLRADSPTFDLGGLTADLGEALHCACEIAAAHRRGVAIDGAFLGTARRRYQEIGHLRLHGVFSEAVVTKSGYAGATTYLTDGEGHLYTRSDVAPGGALRAVGAYDASAAIGDAVLSHCQLARAGLFLSGATASRDGRLGSGANVRAVRAQRQSTWDDAALAPLWARPLREQLARMTAADGLPPEVRSAGWDLAFVHGTLRGLAANAVWLSASSQGGEPEVALRLVAAAQHPSLRHRDNLLALGGLTGTPVRLVGRIRLAEPRSLELLAVGPAQATSDAPLVLPAELGGRACVAWDRIRATAAHHADTVESTVRPPGPFAALERRIERASLGGTATLRPESSGEVLHEAVALDALLMPGSASVLRDLLAAATQASRRFTGTRDVPAPAVFALAWLRAFLQLRGAQRAFAASMWM